MRKFVVLLVVIASLSSAAVRAQTSSANLSGTVKDTSGAVLPGVTVTARNVATNETRVTTSENDGLYRLIHVVACLRSI